MSGYAATATLVRVAARRDRVLAPVSALVLVALAGGSASATVALYPDPTDAVAAAQAAAASPAIVAMYGPVADPADPDAVAVVKTLLLGGVLLAVLAVTLVRRHTRADEEAGLTELVGAGVVGRRAPLAAAVVVASATVVVTSALAALSLVAAGLGASGAVAFGLAWAGIGLTFVGVTAVAAQLTTTTRGCSAVTIGALGVAYLLRAVGDTTPGLGGLTWLSPLGWAEKVEAFGADRLVVPLLPLAVTVALLAVAGTLLEHRDLGAGLLPARPGPAVGGRSLGSPPALAWRLQRGLLVGWVGAYAVLGLVLGAVAGNVTAFVDSPGVSDLLTSLGGSAGSIGDVFVSTELHFLAIGAAAYGIGAALQLRSEESSAHTEQLLATPVSRRALLGAHAVIALAGSAVALLVVGTTLAVASAAQHGGVVASLGHVLPAALAPVPAVWVCVGIALLLYGALPRAALLAWGLLGAFLVVGEFGPLLDLPPGLVGLSPFAHGAVVPGGAVPSVPLVVLALVAAALVFTGGVAFRRRDLTTG